MTKRKFTPPTSFPAEYVTRDGVKVTLLAKGTGEAPYCGQLEYSNWIFFRGDGSCAPFPAYDLHDLPKTKRMSDLKPCPFCGGEAEHSVGKTGDGRPWHYVECIECGASGPTNAYADHNIDVVRFRASRWNTRTPDPAAIWREAMEAAARTAGYSGAIQDPRDGCYAGSKPVMGPDVAEEIRAIPNPYEVTK